MNRKSRLILMFLSLLSITVYSQQIKPIEGRWNLIIEQDGKQLPSWLEVRHSGNDTLVGRFVYAFGSARPIAEVKEKDGKFSFAIPPQWEPGERYMEFEAKLEGDVLKGTMVYTDGKTYPWTASRAPELPFTENPKWGEHQHIFNGKDLGGWQALGAEN